MDQARTTISDGRELNEYWRNTLTTKKVARAKNAQISLKEKFKTMDALRERSETLRRLTPSDS